MPLIDPLYNELNVLIMIGFGLLLFFARYKFKLSFLVPALFYGFFKFFNDIKIDCTNRIKYGDVLFPYICFLVSGCFIGLSKKYLHNV